MKRLQIDDLHPIPARTLQIYTVKMGIKQTSTPGLHPPTALYGKERGGRGGWDPLSEGEGGGRPPSPPPLVFGHLSVRLLFRGAKKKKHTPKAHAEGTRLRYPRHTVSTQCVGWGVETVLRQPDLHTPDPTWQTLNTSNNK